MECDDKKYYTSADRRILDERERLLGPFPLFKQIAQLVALASGGWFAVLALGRIYDFFEQREEEKRRKEEQKKELMSKMEQERRELEYAKFIEQTKAYIKEREERNEPLTFKDVIAIRMKLTEHTRIPIEEAINEHMKKYNPKWR